MKKICILCFMACALCACDLRDKMIQSDILPPSENSIKDYTLSEDKADYVLPVSDKDYVQYSNKNDYVMPAQKPIKSNAPQPIEKSAPVIENKISKTQPVEKPEVKPSPKLEIKPKPKLEPLPVVESEPDDVLLVPAKVAQAKPKPVIVKPSTGEITVEKGDTVYSLSKKYNIVLRDLIDENNLSAPFTISVGQKLKIPNARIHEVAAGETLYSISRRYSVDLNSLAMENKITAPYSLSVGQKLKLPAKVQLLPIVNTPVVAPVVKPEKKVVAEKESPKKATKEISKKSASTARPSSGPKLITEKRKVSSSPAKPLPKISAQKKMRFSWPVRGKILSGFGYKKNGLYNDGINIGAKLGTTVKATEAGVVAYAGNELKGMGNLIIIQHANGWMSVYAHLDTMSVRRGSRLTIGEKIGTIGKTGKVSEPQLHFEIRKGTKAYNPRKELR